MSSFSDAGSTREAALTAAVKFWFERLASLLLFAASGRGRRSSLRFDVVAILLVRIIVKI